MAKMISDSVIIKVSKLVSDKSNFADEVLLSDEIIEQLQDILKELINDNTTLIEIDDDFVPH